MAYVYALLMKNGIVKIGATGNPWSRAVEIACELQQRPVEMVSAELRDGVDMFREEAYLLAIASDIVPPAKGREYFRGLSFATAISVISKARAGAFITRRFDKTDRGISLKYPERRAVFLDGPICPVPEAWHATPALAAEGGV